jgi:hypothetical protein
MASTSPNLSTADFSEFAPVQPCFGARCLGRAISRTLEPSKDNAESRTGCRRSPTGGPDFVKESQAFAEPAVFGWGGFVVGSSKSIYLPRRNAWDLSNNRRKREVYQLSSLKVPVTLDLAIQFGCAFFHLFNRHGIQCVRRQASGRKLWERRFAPPWRLACSWPAMPPLPSPLIKQAARPLKVRRLATPQLLSVRLSRTARPSKAG